MSENEKKRRGRPKGSKNRFPRKSKVAKCAEGGSDACCGGCGDTCASESCEPPTKVEKTDCEVIVPVKDAQ